MRDERGLRVLELTTYVTALSKPAPADALETLLVEPGRCLFFAYRNILIAVWIGQADLAAAQANARAARMMALRHKAGRSFIAFVLGGLPAPMPEAVPIFAKLMAQSAELACIAHVLEGSGFWASGLRGMIGNAYREGGAAAQSKIGSNAQEIVAWLAAQHSQQTGVAIEAGELNDALAKAREIAEAARR